MIALSGFLVLLAIPAWTCRHWPAPPSLTWQVALRYLLLCCACLLMSVLARDNPLVVDFWPLAFGGSVLLTALLAIVLWWEVRQ